MIDRRTCVRLALAACLLSACSPADLQATHAPIDAAAAQGVALTVQPAEVDVAPGEAASFTATVYGTANPAVTWSVLEADGGSVDAQGLYTAPAAPGTYHVIATSAADGRVVSSATATVAAPAPSPTPAPAALPDPVPTPAPTPAPVARGGRWSTGYWEAGFLADFSKINWRAYTHVVHVALMPNADGSVRPHFSFRAADAAAFVSAAHAQGVKALLGLGGFDATAGFRGAASSAGNRAALIAGTIQTMQQYGYDGIDLDWEDNVASGSYLALHQEFRDAVDRLSPRPMLTAAVGDWYLNNFTSAVAALMDQVNAMTYYTAAADMPGHIQTYTRVIPRSKLGIGFGMGDPNDTGHGHPEVDTGASQCLAKARFAVDNGFAGFQTWGMGNGNYAACEAQLVAHLSDG